jgi:hypothetical protein
VVTVSSSSSSSSSPSSSGGENGDGGGGDSRPMIGGKRPIGSGDSSSSSSSSSSGASGGDGGGASGGDGGGDADGDGSNGGGESEVSHSDWENLLASRSPKRKRGDDGDMETMTGQESLGSSTRGRFSFDTAARLNQDFIMNFDMEEEKLDQVRNAGQGRHVGDEGHVLTRPAMLSRQKGEDPRLYTNSSDRTIYTGGRRG